MEMTEENLAKFILELEKFKGVNRVFKYTRSWLSVTEGVNHFTYRSGMWLIYLIDEEVRNIHFKHQKLKIVAEVVREPSEIAPLMATVTAYSYTDLTKPVYVGKTGANNPLGTWEFTLHCSQLRLASEY